MTSDLVLNRFFTRNTFQKLICGQDDVMMRTVIRHCKINPTGKNNCELIHEVYLYLSRFYRNEYYYKNTLLNTLLLGRHSVTTTTALTEVPVGKAKADFVLINGRAIVYEIKTQLDNLDRLEHQINEYYRAFRYVVVVTYPENYDLVCRHISNPNVGIYVITSKGTISRKLVREPQEYTGLLCKETIFHILRKNEYEGILKQHIGELPQVTSFKYFKACRKLFVDGFTSILAQSELEKALKRRIHIDKCQFMKIPRELKFLAYFSEMTSADYEQAMMFLNTTSRAEEDGRCIFRS